MNEPVVDVKKALGQIIFFDVKQDLSNLSQDQKKALDHCVKAAKIITDLYLTQVRSDNVKLREELGSRTDEKGKEISEYFNVHGGPWDSFNGDKAFVPGVGGKPKGIAFYPADISKEEWNKALAENPSHRDAFESPYTVIKRIDGALTPIPYSEAYAEFLKEAAVELKAASDLLPQGHLKKFLELRADAFLSNNYQESDIEWIDTDGHPFEVTIGPYEVYADGLFGIKAAFESLIALPDEESTSYLRKFSNAVPEFDALLAERLGHKPRGGVIPLEVVRDIHRGGEAAFGGKFVAYNLPNDKKIHDLKGSKKVFSRTMMEAKFANTGRPVAEKILKSEDLKYYQFKNRLLFVLGHELAHGIGPGVRIVDGREVSFEVLLRDLHSMLEEAKADMLGIALLDHFEKKGLITREELIGCITTEITAFIQGWRGGYTEAHAAGALIEYNWIKKGGGFRYDEAFEVFDIDFEKTRAAMIALADEFLKIQMAGDYDMAADFIKKWGFVPPEIPGIIERLKDMPIELHPTYLV